jgi:type I restriction enzyme R subunit
VNCRRDFEPRIRKLLDIHISASEVTQLTKTVNIFDDEAFEKVVAERDNPASQADLIAHATKRTITERMAEDPAFYEKFSRLIQQAIDNFRKRRITELEYLKKAREIRSAVVNRTDEEIPADLQEDADARAFFGLLQPAIQNHEQDENQAKSVAREAALAIREIFRKRCIVGFASNQDAQNAMLNDLDDFLFDEVRDRHGIPLSQNEMDELLNRLMQLARHRAAL